MGKNAPPFISPAVDLLTFCYLFSVPAMAYRTPLRSTASSKTKIFESGFIEASSSALPLLPTLLPIVGQIFVATLPIAGQIFVVTLLTQSISKDIKAVQVESKSDLKAVLEASIHRAELNSGEIKAVQVGVEIGFKSCPRGVESSSSGVEIGFKSCPRGVEIGFKSCPRGVEIRDKSCPRNFDPSSGT